MKNLYLSLVLLILSLSIFAQQNLVIVQDTETNLKGLYENTSFTVHHHANGFVIGSSNGTLQSDHKILDQNPWKNTGDIYYLVYLPETGKDAYLNQILNHSNLLYTSDEFIVISTVTANAPYIVPAVHGGVVSIQNLRCSLPQANIPVDFSIVALDSTIVNMMNEVDTAILRASIQHLQDYGTRNAYSPEAVQAANWIYDQYSNLGLSVEFHDFTMPGGPASDNVIATLTGTKYPDEYVVLGGHYDSYTGNNYAPGADDNASGSMGVLEVARIMSQYSFDRSIIFCAFGGEEYGLYGSAAWASQAAADGMNILGYFNMDMVGYLHPGNSILTDIIAPASAQELVDFYIDVCETYLPDFITGQASLSGGDSDHTSFNNNGYMGIFPFEDANNYSPYIHSANDVVDLSVNSFDMCSVFTQATLASVATMANQIASPSNLSAIAGDQEVILDWEAIESVDHYNIYRDNDVTPIAQSTEPDYIDTDVTNGQAYLYFVTAIFLESGLESPPSNEVEVVPMPAIILPFMDTYETGAPYWTMEGSWGLKDGIFYSPSNSLTESPQGDYAHEMDISATLRSVDFSSYTDVNLSFWTKYQIEADYDYMYLEVSVDGSSWDLLKQYTGTQNFWVAESFSLDDYVGQENVSIRFRFYSDSYVAENGMFIDDFMLEVEGVGIDDQDKNKGKISVYPNPASEMVYINSSFLNEGEANIKIIDASGKLILEKFVNIESSGSNLTGIRTSEIRPGIYMIKLEQEGNAITKKLIIE